MKKETTVTFEESDFELLKGDIPRDPCLKCTPAERMSCCGCHERRDYNEKMKPFSEASINEYAQTFLYLRDSLSQLQLITRDMKSEIENLPEQLKDIVMDSDTIFRKGSSMDNAIFEMFKSVIQKTGNDSSYSVLDAAINNMQG